MGPISGGEFVVLLVLAAIVLGPERLPNYAQQLARLVRELRRMAQGASEHVRKEMGEEFDDIDWRKLDPRQYDPRKIVRDALADDDWDDDDPFGFKALAKDVDAVVRDEPASSNGSSRPANGAAAGTTRGGASTPGATSTNDATNGTVNGSSKPATSAEAAITDDIT